MREALKTFTMGRRQLEDAACCSHCQTEQAQADTASVTARQAASHLSHAFGHEESSILSYSSITEGKLGLFLQNPICFPFPLLPSYPGQKSCFQGHVQSEGLIHTSTEVQKRYSKSSVLFFRLCALVHSLCQN